MSVVPSFLSPEVLGGNKTFGSRVTRDNSLRVGTVIAAYAPKDDRNLNKKVFEYDVEVFASDGGSLATTVTYPNCQMQTGFGGIADRYQWSPRVQVRNVDGSIKEPGTQVLVECVNGISRQGVIVAAVAPEGAKEQGQEFKAGPRLEWEYNGLGAVIDKDGALTVTRRGPTDSKGVVSNSTGAGAQILIGKNGEIVIQTGDGKEVVTIDEQGGTIKINANSGVKIEVAGGQLDVQAAVGVKLGGTEPLIKGMTYAGLQKTFLAQVAAFAAAMTAACGTLQSPPTADPGVMAAAPAMVTAFTTLTTAVATLLSTFDTALSLKNTTD